MDEVPEEGSLIYSKADLPKKQRNKKTPAENVHIWPKKPVTDVQLKKHMPLQKEKKYDFSRSQPTKEDKLICYDKNCQETKRPKKVKSVMQSVTKEENTEDMQLTKPAIKSICRDKNCQSTRCYRSPRRPKCDKNCQ